MGSKQWAADSGQWKWAVGSGRRAQWIVGGQWVVDSNGRMSVGNGHWALGTAVDSGH